MKRTYFFMVAAIFAVMGALVACSEDADENKISGPTDKFEDIQITNQIDLKELPENYEVSNLKILTLNGEQTVDSKGASKISTYQGLFPQILMLTNANDEVILMARGDFREGETNKMSVRSTALTLVTMHPALSGAKSPVYGKLEQLVIESPAFAELEGVIAESVKKGQSFINPENGALTTALNKVFEQVVATSEDEKSDGELPNLENDARSFVSPLTRAPELKGVTNIAGINVGPFHVTAAGSKVVIENYSLTPFYSGLVEHHNQKDNFDIPSGDDRGISFFFDNSWGSQKVEYPFVREGEYQFAFDKTTMESYFDQARHTVCNIIEVLGLPLSKDWILKMSTDMVKYMTARGLDLTSFFANPNNSGWDITFVICDAFIDYIKDGHLEKMLLNMGTKQFAAQMAQAILKKVVAIYTVYKACRGAINAVMRITMRLEAPDNVSFGLYYYQGNITSATKASIAKHSGDDQKGLIGRRLNEPVRVKVTTIASDGSEVAASNFHRVKFTTDAHNGTPLNEVVATDPDGYAQTFWTLDAENEETQHLKAVVIDVVTGEVISDEVVFSATPTQAANVTFTLDWNPSDTNCDIDLHIYDPNGHHIYYADMRCSCGAYLDRDDRHGPGPEHIYYTQAKPGRYNVYVHHYNSDTKGTVGFTVTTEYDERRFVNRSSVSYHEMQYIGTLEVDGNAAGSRGMKQNEVIRFYQDANAPVLSTENLPKK